MTELSSAVQRRFMSTVFPDGVSVGKPNVNANQTMKTSIRCSLFSLFIAGTVAATLTACESEKSEAQHKEAKQAKLMAQAKVSQEDATKIALAKVPHGTVKEAE